MDSFAFEIDSTDLCDLNILDFIPDLSQITGYKVEFGAAEETEFSGSEESGSDSRDSDETEEETEEGDSEEAIEAAEEDPEEESEISDNDNEEETEEVSEEDPEEEEKESFTENTEEAEEAFEAYEEDEPEEEAAAEITRSSGDSGSEDQQTETVVEYGSDQLSFIAEQNAQSIELLGILSGCALFIVTAELLKYIYKFFRMFF